MRKPRSIRGYSAGQCRYTRTLLREVPFCFDLGYNRTDAALVHCCRFPDTHHLLQREEGCTAGKKSTHDLKHTACRLTIWETYSLSFSKEIRLPLVLHSSRLSCLCCATFVDGTYCSSTSGSKNLLVHPPMLDYLTLMAGDNGALHWNHIRLSIPILHYLRNSPTLTAHVHISISSAAPSSTSYQAG